MNVCALHVSAGQEILYEATETHKRSSAPDRVRAEEEEEEEEQTEEEREGEMEGLTSTGDCNKYVVSNPLIRQQGGCGAIRFKWRDALPCWETRSGRVLGKKSVAVRVLSNTDTHKDVQQFHLIPPKKIHDRTHKHAHIY